MHPLQPTDRRTTACVAAEYLPVNCGTAPVDVADVVCCSHFESAAAADFGSPSRRPTPSSAKEVSDK